MSIYTDAVIVSINSVSIVIFIVFLGALATRQNVSNTQLLTQSGSSNLSDLIFNILLPCLLFTEIMKSLTISNALEFSLLFLFCVSNFYSVHIFFGSFIGWIFGKLSKANVHTTRLMMVSIGFQETTAIPLVLATVLGTSSLPNKGKNFSNSAISCVLIYTVFSTLFKWTYAYWYLVFRLVKRKSGDKVEEVLIESEKVMEKKSRCWTLRKTLNPPIYAALFAAPLALIPFMQEYVFCGTDAVLEENIFSALELLGGTVSPLICLLLGSKLSKGYPASATISNLHIILIIIGKTIIMPTIGLIICYFSYSIGIINKSVSLMVMVMYAAPTSKQLLMVYKEDKIQLDNLSKVFLFMYLIVVLPIAAWTIVFIVLLYR